MSLLVQRDEHVTTLLLDRPRRAHAYDRALLLALADAVAALDTPVVVVGSTGVGSFCAGADLHEMKSATPVDALDLLSQRVFDALARSPAVSVAAVQGPAVAGGFELALACDLRVAAPGARFWLPEPTLGLIPAAGGCTRLPRLVGVPRAKQVILGGLQLSAQQALEWGLVARLVATPLLEAQTWGQQIAQRDPLAQRLAKQIIDGVLPTEASLRAERMAEALLYSRRDSKENKA